MRPSTTTKEKRQRRRARIRAKVSGTAERPRLAIFRSNNFTSAQLIDDVNKATLASATTQKITKGTPVEKALEAGKELGIKPFGIRAMNSLRVEKSYKLVGTELSIEYSPYESGLDRFVHPNKGNFIGLDALNKWREKGFENKLVTLEVHNTTDSDVLGNNPIYKNDKVVGRATGGDFGFRLNKSIALGMIKPELATTGQKLKIDILGKMHDATILDESPYDPENKLLRA